MHLRIVANTHIAFKNLRNERADVEFSLFGHPDWILYQNDYKEYFKNCDTYIYSRFYVNADGIRYYDFMTSYIKWYGCDLLNAVPSFGLLGYDTGLYFLSRYSNLLAGESAFSGIQNDIMFQKVDEQSGYINKALYFIHFTPEGIFKETK